MADRTHEGAHHEDRRHRHARHRVPDLRLQPLPRRRGRGVESRRVGVLGAVAHTPEQLEIDLAWIEEEIGDRPYGVDLIVPGQVRRRGRGRATRSTTSALIPDSNGVRRRHPRPLQGARAPRRRQRRPAASPATTATRRSRANRPGPQLDIALAHRTAFVANALGPPPQFHDRACQGGGPSGRRPGRPAAARRAPRQAPASTSSSPRVPRPAGTPARSDRWCSSPRSSTRSAHPGARRRGHRPRPPDGGGDGARRPRRVVRIGVAHDRRGRDPPGGEGEVPRRHIGRHDAVALAHRQAGPHADARRGPTSGTAPTRPSRSACHCSRSSSPRRSGASTGRRTRRARAPRSWRTTSSARSSAR